MLPVETPFKIYTGLTGQPLNNGYVYFGTANQNPITSPITVYWDAAGTQPAAQPLRTVNGYIMRAGTPANVFVGVSYSELVKDSTGQQVFYARNSDDFSIGTSIINFITSLAASGGSALVGFLQAGVGAVLRTVQSKLRDTVSLRDFGCVIDGVTDDTAALAACLTYAKANGLSVWHPGGVCRVTAGFVQSTPYHNLIIRGNGPIDEAYLGDNGASTFLLDSTDPASFFISLANVAGSTALTLNGVTFKCAQFVQDREFIKSSGYLYHHNVQNCTFTAVEQPFTYADGGYFQNASYRNVMFLNSGSFHSKCSTAVGSLVGTLLILDNVNHEGGVPVNTEKKVCNLTGIRQIEARNFLLEGILPAAGWTILKLANPYDSYYTRALFAIITNFHSEWSSFSPSYVVEQVGGSVKFTSLIGINATSKYKVSSLGRVIIEETSFSGTLNEPTTFFEKENGQCIVDFVNCAARTLDTTIAGYNHHNTQYASVTDGNGNVILSNETAQEIYKWDGAIFDGDQVVYSLTGGTTSVYSTDAVYGRKLVITPNAGVVNVRARIKTAAMLVPGDQVMVACRAKLPTFAAGLWAFQLDVDLSTKFTLFFDSTKSGQFVDVIIPFVLLTTPNNMAIGFGNGTTAGVATDLEVYSIAIYHGNSIPRRQLPCYPKNTISYSTAAPTTGTWARGDIVINSNPAVGSPKAWRCTVTGTPGTWVSEGNL